MTTEDDFNAMLDADPTDWQTRLVFAGWLEEDGDERAEGYQVLAMMRLYPHPKGEGSKCPWFTNIQVDHLAQHYIPGDWFDLTEMPGKGILHLPDHDLRDDATRREVEDSATRGFARLPASRRAELLSSSLTVTA